ncbi:MAG: peptidase [Paenibacillus sp.]|jgi:murein DD-endopeptidase MepM/ murein hydrolase activator NlpD|nr:peptidase [Paenibacillus sp.]
MKTTIWYRLSLLAILGFVLISPLSNATVSATHDEADEVEVGEAGETENNAEAVESSATDEKDSKPASAIYAERKALLDQVSQATGIPWTYLAAIDQYERTLTIANPKKRTASKGLISVYYPDQVWAGMLNPNPLDTDKRSIAIFGGKGRDGSGDGLADRSNDLDLLATMVAGLSGVGSKQDKLHEALSATYKNSRAVERIEQFIKLYEHYGRIDLNEHAFPLPIKSTYSYRSTWGASRGWGGARMHEGTDLFAGHGVPVRSTCYGIVEIKGWNNYGGWRIGLRDLNNVYHYYAHLSGFDKSIQQGDIVKPGQVLGWVGSSGYGKQGTQGKFPPHLHFGLYRDNGKIEWSYDPYPSLRRWEREDEQRQRVK